MTTTKTKANHPAEGLAVLALMLGFAVALLVWQWPALPARVAAAGLILSLGIGQLRPVHWQWGPWK